MRALSATPKPAPVGAYVPPRAVRFAGKPSCKVEASTQRSFCVSTTTEGPWYPEQDPQDVERSDWWIRVRENEPGCTFEPGETDVPVDGLVLQIAQTCQLYGKEASKESTDDRIDKIVSIEELRALFHGIAVLRERMQAAGFDV